MSLSSVDSKFKPRLPTNTYLENRLFSMHRYLTHILLPSSLSVSIGIQFNHDNNSTCDIEKNKPVSL